jgi:hypothetical protein
LASQPACPGDGNIDGKVDALDIQNWTVVSHSWGLSSIYDINLDGLTNGADLTLIGNNQVTCPKTSSVY